MHNQMQPSGRVQGFGLHNDETTGAAAQVESTGLRNQPITTAYSAGAGAAAQSPSAGTGSFMQTPPASAPYATTAGTNAQTAGYGAAQPMTGTAANSQQISYDQFQEQLRQRQEQEQLMARQALLSAGADRQSDRTRAVLQQLASLSQEIQRAENQIQVQMDAQLRQLQLIHQRVRQAENLIQETLPNMQTPASGLRQ